MKLEDVINFVKGNWNYLQYQLKSNKIKQEVKEQALHRAMLCSPCLEEGKCKICGCSTPAMFFAPDKEDSLGSWGKMMSKQRWEKYKKDNDIFIPDNFLDVIKNIENQENNQKDE